MDRWNMCWGGHTPGDLCDATASGNPKRHPLPALSFPLCAPLSSCQPLAQLHTVGHQSPHPSVLSLKHFFFVPSWARPLSHGNSPSSLLPSVPRAQSAKQMIPVHMLATRLPARGAWHAPRPTPVFPCQSCHCPEQPTLQPPTTPCLQRRLPCAPVKIHAANGLH